jgi:hypothetical protein
MNATSFQVMDYDDFAALKLRKNKANSNPVKRNLKSPHRCPKLPKEPVLRVNGQARRPGLRTKDLTFDLLSCYNKSAGGVSWANTSTAGTAWYAGRLPKSPAHIELYKGFDKVGASWCGM